MGRGPGQRPDVTIPPALAAGPPKTATRLSHAIDTPIAIDRHAPTLAAEDFKQLFLRDVPLLDVRAPVEFQHGALPCATNLPLLDDEQRQQVGLRYREGGQAAAIELGHELIGPALKEQRLASWTNFLKRHPDAVLYCYRGGLRSQLVQQWLMESGVRLPRVAGGYKALRRSLIDTLERVASEQHFILIAGQTGSAKTHLVRALEASVDLEGWARHRGSAFGPRVEAQPSQSDFENGLAIAFLKVLARRPDCVFLEDESRAIGSLSLPEALFQRMRSSPLAVIETSLESRIDTILDDYIRCNHADFIATDPEQGERRFRDYLTGSLSKIQRRLGGEHYTEIAALMQTALDEQDRSGDLAGHRAWIARLLQDYYDPMYAFQLSKKQGQILFRGEREAFLEWANRRAAGRVAGQS